MKHLFFNLLYQRGSILIGLLLLQVFSSMIMAYYEAILASFLYLFTTMITSTGGNTSSQTSALVIQGLSSGEITSANIKKFLTREFVMALMLASILGAVAAVRVYVMYPGYVVQSLAIGFSLGIIVLVSVMLGSLIPLGLKKLNLDPAFSAGPFLATLMDILGLFIYCYVSQLIIR